MPKASALILCLLFASAAAAENVVWTSATGVSVSGNSLTKTGSAGWNAGAISTQQLSWGPVYVEFTAAETNTSRACGLSKGNTDNNYTDIDFAIYLSGGTVYVQEGATTRFTGSAYTTGDKFRVEAEPGVVRYRVNGAVI